MPVNKLRKDLVTTTDLSDAGAQQFPSGIASRPLKNIYPLVTVAAASGGASDFNSVTSSSAINIDGVAFPIGSTLTSVVASLLGTDVVSIGYNNATGVVTITSSNGSTLTTTLSMEDDRTVTTTAITIDGTTYPIGTNLNTIITALTSAELANGEFRGVYATAATLNAVTSPQVGDTAYVSNTDTLLNGENGVAGSVYWTGAVWSVYQPNSGTSDGGSKGNFANLTALNAAVVSPSEGDSATVDDSVGITGGSSGVPATVSYNSGSWSVGQLIQASASTEFQYTSGQAEIWATGAGITFTVNATTGEWVFAIPTGVDIIRAVINFASTDTDATGDAYILLDYATLRTFNTSIENAKIPFLAVATDAVPSRGTPSTLATGGIGTGSKQYGLSAIGGGDGSDMEIAVDSVAAGTNNVMYLKF